MRGKNDLLPFKTSSWAARPARNQVASGGAQQPRANSPIAGRRYDRRHAARVIKNRCRMGSRGKRFASEICSRSSPETAASAQPYRRETDVCQRRLGLEEKRTSFDGRVTQGKGVGEQCCRRKKGKRTLQHRRNALPPGTFVGGGGGRDGGPIEAHGTLDPHTGPSGGARRIPHSAIIGAQKQKQHRAIKQRLPGVGRARKQKSSTNGLPERRTAGGGQSRNKEKNDLVDGTFRDRFDIERKFPHIRLCAGLGDSARYDRPCPRQSEGGRRAKTRRGAAGFAFAHVSYRNISR